MKADFKAIRKIITDEKTLGASANCFNDIVSIYDSGVVDYVGCGPFAPTNTKPNDYQTLGIEGYKTISSKMNKDGIDIPLLAVGGIKIEDVDPLISTGIYGIAVSAAINLAENPSLALKDFHRKLY